MDGRKKWKSRHGKAAAVFISLALLLSGCQKTESMLAGMGEEKGYGLPEIMVVAMSQKNTYEKICTAQIWSAQVDESGKTFEEYTKEQLKSFMNEMETMNLFAKEKEISLTPEESAAMDQAAEEYLSALTPEDISYMGVDETSVRTVFHDYFLANKVVGELTGDLNLEVSDSEAKVITISEVRTEDLQTAENIAKQVTSGISLERAASDNGLEVSSRNLGRAEEGEDFEYAAFGLETGEFSSVVEDEGEYCIIRCNNDYNEEATAERKEQIYEARKEKAFQDVYGGFKESITIKDSEKSWESLSLSGDPHAVNGDFFEIYRKYAGDQAEELGEQ